MKEEQETKFKGSELIRVSKGIQKDIMAILLKPDNQYSESEAAERVNAFLKKEVLIDGRR